MVAPSAHAPTRCNSSLVANEALLLQHRCTNNTRDELRLVFVASSQATVRCFMDGPQNEKRDNNRIARVRKYNSNCVLLTSSFVSEYIFWNPVEQQKKCASNGWNKGQPTCLKPGRPQNPSWNGFPQQTRAPARFQLKLQRLT